MNNSYDCVIIGGGLAGLSAALRLTNEGKKVAVLEKHHMPGGYATNFKRKDKDGNFYTFDVALHGIGGLRKDEALHYVFDEKLDILNSLTLLEKPETATLLTQTGEENDIPSNFDEYKKYLVSKYPKEQLGIEKLFTFLMEVKEDMFEVTTTINRMPRHQHYLQSISLYDFLKTYVSNEAFIEEFSFLWLYYGLPPKHLNTLYYILPWISYHIGGTFYIQGGAGKLSDTLKAAIESKGSHVYLLSEVVKIATYNEKITSVTTKKGVTFTSEQFIIACDPSHIWGLIHDSSPSVKSYKDQLSHLKNGISLSQVYIGLDCPSHKLGMTKGDYFIHVTDHEQTYKSILNGNYNHMNFGLTCYDILDPSLNGKEQGVICMVIGDQIENWPAYKSDAYKEQKQKLADTLITQAEKSFPHIREHIKILEVGTPHTMKRYTNNTGGSVYGWAQSVGQGGFDRLGFKTSFTNVLLAGAWSNPGGGFEGAILSGVMCADRLLRHMEPKPQINTSVTQMPPMSLNAFMAGMVANLNPKKAKNLDLVLHFCFDHCHNFYLQIKNKKGKLLKQKPARIDLTIHTSYTTWYQIAFEGKSGADALFDGEIELEGSIDTFMLIPELFATDAPSKTPSVSASKLKFPSVLWINLALVPWILYWSIGHVLNPLYLCLITTCYTLGFIYFIKPKGHKELTPLESLGILTFTGYSVLSSTFTSSNPLLMNYWADIILFISFFFSALINKPLTAPYACMEYPSIMTKTKLFTSINRVLTLLWGSIFFIKFLVQILLPSPFNYLSYLFIVMGIVLSYYYPKKKLN